MPEGFWLGSIWKNRSLDATCLLCRLRTAVHLISTSGSVHWQAAWRQIDSELVLMLCKTLNIVHCKPWWWCSFSPVYLYVCIYHLLLCCSSIAGREVGNFILWSTLPFSPSHVNTSPKSIIKLYLEWLHIIQACVWLYTSVCDFLLLFFLPLFYY